MKNESSQQNNDNQSPRVTPWAWCWRAVYRLPDEVAHEARLKRGQAVPEQQLQFTHNEDGSYTMHPFSVIEQERLRFFEVYPFYDKSQKPYRIVMSEGMRLLFLRRQLDIGYLGGKTVEFYVVGFKKGNQHSYVYLLPDGTTYVSSVDNIDLPELLLYV